MTTRAELQRRFSRQSRLVEIGASGQQKLAAATIAIASAGFVRTMEERYVLGAGMNVEEAHTSSEHPPAELTALGLRHAPAREVADGALRALVALRGVLGIAS